MATVRDTKEAIAFFEGREVLDPNTIPFADWVLMIDSVVKVMTPKHLHGFQAAQDIAGELESPHGLRINYSSPPARIWLDLPGSSWEFRWHFQYLVCGVKEHAEEVGGVDILTREYLLFSKASEFFILTTTWELRNGGYHFSNNTNDGHLKVRHVSTSGVVEWCFEDKDYGPYLLRGVLEDFFAATEETVNDLTGKLERATEQRQAVGQRLSTISWVEPGDTVWIVCHHHSWDRDLNNEYFPIERKVLKIKNGMAHFKDESPRSLWDCYMTKHECQEACPAPHRDD